MTVEDQIQRRAYELWEQAGCPEGEDQSFWFKAIAEMAQGVADTMKAPTKRKPAPRKKVA